MIKFFKQFINKDNAIDVNDPTYNKKIRIEFEEARRPHINKLIDIGMFKFEKDEDGNLTLINAWETQPPWLEDYLPNYQRQTLNNRCYIAYKYEDGTLSRYKINSDYKVKALIRSTLYNIEVDDNGNAYVEKENGSTDIDSNIKHAILKHIFVGDDNNITIEYNDHSFDKVFSNKIKHVHRNGLVSNITIDNECNTTISYLNSDGDYQVLGGDGEIHTITSSEDFYDFTNTPTSVTPDQIKNNTFEDYEEVEASDDVIWGGRDPYEAHIRDESEDEGEPYEPSYPEPGSASFSPTITYLTTSRKQRKPKNDFPRQSEIRESPVAQYSEDCEYHRNNGDFDEYCERISSYSYHCIIDSEGNESYAMDITYTYKNKEDVDEDVENERADNAVSYLFSGAVCGDNETNDNPSDYEGIAYCSDHVLHCYNGSAGYGGYSYGYECVDCEEVMSRSDDTRPHCRCYTSLDCGDLPGMCCDSEGGCNDEYACGHCFTCWFIQGKNNRELKAGCRAARPDLEVYDENNVGYGCDDSDDEENCLSDSEIALDN